MPKLDEYATPRSKGAQPIKDDPNNGNKVTEPAIPKLIWFLGLHAGIGMALGVVMASLLLLANIGGLKVMLNSSSDPFTPIFLLYFGCAMTLGSLSMGIAVMMLPYDKPPGKNNGQ